MNMIRKILVTSAVSLTLGATQFVQMQPVVAAGQTGYINLKNVGWRWLENGHPYTGFRYYMGTYYWFTNGIRQDTSWHHAWGLTYYTDSTGRAVQGNHVINGTAYNFGNNGTFFLRNKITGYVDAGRGWRWYESGKPYTGIRNYMGAYYYFENGVRQQNKFVQAYGLVYYVGSDGRTIQGNHSFGGEYLNFGNDGTYYLRTDARVHQPIRSVPQLNIGHFPAELQGTWYAYNDTNHTYSVLSISAHEANSWTEDSQGRRTSTSRLVQSTAAKYKGFSQHAVISTNGQKSATGNQIWSIVDTAEQFHDYNGRTNTVGAVDGRAWWLSNVDSGGRTVLNWNERQGYVERYTPTRTPINYSRSYTSSIVPDLGV